MVTISAYYLRQNREGKSFVALELQGDFEMVQSSETGRFYATAKRCSVTSTFTEEIAKNLIGKQLKGKIERVESDPYEYTIKETGQVITLQHSYVYLPEEGERSIVERSPMMAF
jgi:hypothetical protein